MNFFVHFYSIDFEIVELVFDIDGSVSFRLFDCFDYFDCFGCWCWWSWWNLDRRLCMQQQIQQATEPTWRSTPTFERKTNSFRDGIRTRNVYYFFRKFVKSNIQFLLIELSRNIFFIMCSIFFFVSICRFVRKIALLRLHVFVLILMLSRQKNKTM
jgi:hypothetical protein